MAVGRKQFCSAEATSIHARPHPQFFSCKILYQKSHGEGCIDLWSHCCISLKAVRQPTITPRKKVSILPLGPRYHVSIASTFSMYPHQKPRVFCSRKLKDASNVHNYTSYLSKMIAPPLTRTTMYLRVVSKSLKMQFLFESGDYMRAACST